jgi:hypothetical protein
VRSASASSLVVKISMAGYRYSGGRRKSLISGGIGTFSSPCGDMTVEGPCPEGGKFDGTGKSS